MKKTLISLFALSFALVVGAASAAKHEAPAKAAAPAAKKEEKKEVCKDKAGKEVKCPEKKKAAEPAKK
jgi:hypothetical protein